LDAAAVSTDTTRCFWGRDSFSTSVFCHPFFHPNALEFTLSGAAKDEKIPGNQRVGARRRRMELSEHSLRAAAALLRNGDLTAEAYAEALLARCAKAQKLNAFIRIEPDAVRRAARHADERRRRGGAIGPLHGMPVALKDNLDTAEFPTTGGTPGLATNRPKRNAPIVQKLLDAGAIVLGKANMHELAFGVTSNNAAFRPARNPYDPSRIAGGSSGGTGVAVGARLTPAGIGSDTGGSIRIPAALCGIAGFRPTTLRWSQAGIIPISHTRDTAGPMARGVDACVLLDGIITGGPCELAPAGIKGLRIGVPRGHFWENLDSETAQIMEGALARLREGGAVLVEGDISGPLDAAAGFPIVLYETVADLNIYLAEHETGLDYAALVRQVESPDVKGILEGLLGAGGVPVAAYREALGKHRPALQEAYRRYFRERGVVVMAFPTTPMPAAKIGEDETVLLNGTPVPIFPTYIRNTSPGSVAGIPGLSLPAGITGAGLPVGLEIDGPEGSDRRLLAIGLALEALLPSLPAPTL
jgi:Asp-tRNA(Asn)/Glu-tRNA(Gln) amidotransferase A subunit family amidase